MSFLLKFWAYLLSFLDWWNGTYLYHKEGYLEIHYRYRFSKYVVHVPYSLTQGPQEVVTKDHVFPLNYQNGLKFSIDPTALGWSQVRDTMFDD